MRESWCSPHDQPSSCSRSLALGCRGSCQNCVPARVPKWRPHPVGSQSDPMVGKKVNRRMCQWCIHLNVWLYENLTFAWVKAEPRPSRNKNGQKNWKECSKKTISNSAHSQQSSVAVQSAPSSLFYYSFSLWKPEFICHSITPADPIIPAGSGDRCCSILTALRLAATLISETSGRHKEDRDRMKREKWKFQFHLKFVDWHDETDRVRGWLRNQLNNNLRYVS